MATKKNEVRPAIEPVVKVNIKKKGASGVIKKVLPNEIVGDTEIAALAGCDRAVIADILNAVAVNIRMGNDVVLGGGSVRFFGCLDKNGDKLLIVSQTMGDFRASISDAKFIAVRRDNAGRETRLTKTQMSTIINESHEREIARYATVSPDTLVTCPQCGFEFRVGKKLQ